MKLKILASCAIALLYLGVPAYAQSDWSATLFMQPYPSPYVSDWESNPNLGYLTVNNNTGSEQSIRLFLRLLRNREQTIITATSTPIIIPSSPPATILDNTSFSDYENADFDEGLRSDIAMTGRFPEGQYQACLRLENLDGAILADNICTEFYIVYPDPPSLIYPSNGEIVISDYPLFQWTPLQVPVQYQIVYNLRIAEILQGQTPEQAIEANIPQFENFNITAPNYLYPLDALPLEQGKTYVWQVQALDQYGYPPSENQGKSEIWGFAFGDTTPPIPPGPVYRTISGRLLNSGTSLPLSQSQVVLYHVESQSGPNGNEYIDLPESLTATSNDEGFFNFEKVRDGAYFKICAQPTGYLGSCRIGLDQYSHGDIDNFDILFGENYADINGHLIDKYSNLPISNIIVQLWQISTISIPDSSGGEPSLETVNRQITSARSDSQGVFSMTHIPGGDNYHIVINDSQYDSLLTSQFTIYGGPSQDLGSYAMSLKLGGITGTVKIAGTDSLISMARVFVFADTGFAFPDDPEDFERSAFEGLPLVGPDTTDQYGAFTFNDIPLNNFDQITSRYVVFVQAQGFNSTLLPARITADSPRLNINVELSHAQAIIYGTIISALDGNPVGDAEVRLVSERSDAVAPDPPHILEDPIAYTNPDGGYVLGDIPPAIYSSLIIYKSGYEAYEAAGPITVVAGQSIRIDATLDHPSGFVQGTVSDDQQAPLFGVIITSPDAPNISEVSQADGSFYVAGMPSGSIRLEFRNPGYADTTHSLEVAAQETTTVNMVMSSYKGSITFIVRDSTSGNPVPNITVKITGQEDQQTDPAGTVSYNGLPVGPTRVEFAPPSGENDSIDYCGRSTNVEIANGLNLPVTIALTRGGRISGFVRTSTGSPIQVATVEIGGNSFINNLTTEAGRFVLRHVPAGNNIVLTASKVGYRTGRIEDINLAVGQQLDSLIIRLEDSPIDSVFGFAIEVDSIADLGGGNKRVIGAIVRVPTTPVLRLADSNFRFYFNDLQVDSRYAPLSSRLALSVTQAPVKVFSRLEATLCDTSGGYLYAQMVDSLHVGEIRGDLVMDNAIPRWIPGSAWATEKIERNLAPAFWADGVYHGAEGANYGLTVNGNSVSATFWGFSISVDYARTTIDSAGFHYFGALRFPRLTREIGIEDLDIKKNESTGRLEFVGVGVKTTPPIEIAIGSFRVIDSIAAWNASGFRADGAIVVGALGRTFGFNNLRISPEGDFLSLVVTADSASGTINVLSSQFRIESLEFGTDEATRVRYFQFSGGLTVPRISQPVLFRNLKYTEENEFSGIIQFNQSKTFASILTVQLQSIEFNRDDRGRFIFVRGNIAFDIPTLHVQAGNFRFYEDGAFNLEQISISFNAGPVLVAVEASWSDDKFEGSGTLVVQPVLNAACQFRYAGTSDWWIKVRAGINIPIGTFTIVEVSGEVGYQEGTWIFGLGGGVTVGQLEKAVRLNAYLRVMRTPDGPIINGNAQVIAFSGMQLGEATINLDFAHDRFTGNILFGFNRSGVEVSAQINVDVQSGQYWYVGGGASLNFFRLAQLNSTLCAANNYNGWMHAFPVTYHPDNQTINGFHADLNYHTGASGYRWSMSIDTWAYLMVNWNGDLAAGAKFTLDCYADLWIIGGSATVNMEAAIQNVQNCLSAYGSAGATLKLWIGCCNRNSGCWSVCWAWIFPCGGSACFDISLAANYNCNSGWDYNLTW